MCTRSIVAVIRLLAGSDVFLFNALLDNFHLVQHMVPLHVVLVLLVVARAVLIKFLNVELLVKLARHLLLVFVVTVRLLKLVKLLDK